MAQVDFLVVQTPSAYNERPELNALRTVASTYHLKMKFPIHEGVGEVRGHQTLAPQCDSITLRDTKQSKTYPIDGLDTHDDLIEE